MRILRIILINLLVTFLLLEGGFRVYHAASGKVPPHSDMSVTREWEWVRARLADGKAGFETRFTYDEHTGWRNAPNIDTVPEHQGRVRTNSQGMRNDSDFPLEAPPGVRRLLVVGDSYSFGFGVSNEESYASRLGELLPKWQVMNLAVSATGTDQNYLMYEHHGRKFKPDVVLLGFYVLDYNRNTYSFRDYAKPLFIPQADGSLRLTNVPVTPPEKLIEQYRNGEKKIGGWHYSYALSAFGQVLTNQIKRDRSENSLGRRTLSGIMELYARRVRENGGTPVWVNFPIRDILDEEESKYRAISDFASAEAKRLGMPVLEMEPVFRDYLAKHPEVKTLWRDKDVGGHMNAEGNRVTAVAIREFLDRSGVLK